MCSKNNYNKLKHMVKDCNVDKIVALSHKNYYDNCCFANACIALNIPVMEFFLKTSRLTKHCTPERIFISCCIKKSFAGAAWILNNFSDINVQSLTGVLSLLCRYNQCTLVKAIINSQIVVNSATIIECANYASSHNNWAMFQTLYLGCTKIMLAVVDILYEEYICAKTHSKINYLYTTTKYININKCIEYAKKHLHFTCIKTLLDIDHKTICRNSSDDIVKFLLMHEQYELATYCINISADFNRDFRMLWACKFSCLDKLKVHIKMNEGLMKTAEMRLLILCIQCRDLADSACWIIKNRASIDDNALIWGHAIKYNRLTIMKCLVANNILPDISNSRLYLEHALFNKMYDVVMLLFDINPCLMYEYYPKIHNKKIKSFCEQKYADDKEFDRYILGPILDVPFQHILNVVSKSSQQSYSLAFHQKSNNVETFDACMSQSNYSSANTTPTFNESSVNAQEFVPESKKQVYKTLKVNCVEPSYMFSNNISRCSPQSIQSNDGYSFATLSTSPTWSPRTESPTWSIPVSPSWPVYSPMTHTPRPPGFY